METTESTLDDVKVLVAETLGIMDRLDSMDASTGLVGRLPELDSMAIVQLVIAIEDRFGFHVDDVDITTDRFETLGTLTAYVSENQRRQERD